MLALQATVLIETLPAAFEMDEILFELREHSAGLNCGRWDYIFSFIKTLRADPKAVMPDRCALHRNMLCLQHSSSLCIVDTVHIAAVQSSLHHHMSSTHMSLPNRFQVTRHTAFSSSTRVGSVSYHTTSHWHDVTYMMASV